MDFPGPVEIGPMPLTYQKPGVYYERVDAGAPKITPIRMDIAGFVGMAERGPVDTPVPVESFRQFESHFGRFRPTAYLAFCVRGFFENGGRRCWVVRVAGGDAGGDAHSSTATIAARSGAPGLEIRASSPGVWGDDLTVEIREARVAEGVLLNHLEGEQSSTVTSTSGFERRSLVRLRQTVPGGALTEIWRIVSDVDHVEGRLIWIQDVAALRLPTDAPLAAFSTEHAITAEAIAIDLLVRRGGRLVETHRSLSLVPDHERYIGLLLRPSYDAPELEARKKLARSPRLVEVHDLRADPADPVEATMETALVDGVDGVASLTPIDYIGEEWSPHDNDLVRRTKRRGMRALDLVSEVATIAIPDIHIQPAPDPATAPVRPCVPDPCLPTSAAAEAPGRDRTGSEQPPTFDDRAIHRVQEALVTHCEARRDRLAVLDPPYATVENDAAGTAVIREWRQRFESKFAVLYWPWVRVSNPLPGALDLTRAIPPSGHAAGRFAATDFEVGVHQAPANTALEWVQDVAIATNDAEHGLLNALGINVIRAVPGRGIRIMGARTLSSDPDARFLSVRRLLMMVIKAIDLSTQWSVFEPNNHYTRAKVRVALVSFLGALWQNGALMGDRPEEAFFVRCDESNNPPESRDLGRLVVDVGVAPSVPFEFVVVRVGRIESALEVSESFVKGGAS